MLIISVQAPPVTLAPAVSSHGCSDGPCFFLCVWHPASPCPAPPEEACLSTQPAAHLHPPLPYMHVLLLITCTCHCPTCMCHHYSPVPITAVHTCATVSATALHTCAATTHPCPPLPYTHATSTTALCACATTTHLCLPLPNMRVVPIPTTALHSCASCHCPTCVLPPLACTRHCSTHVCCCCSPGLTTALYACAATPIALITFSLLCCPPPPLLAPQIKLGPGRKRSRIYQAETPCCSQVTLPSLQSVPESLAGHRGLFGLYPCRRGQSQALQGCQGQWTLSARAAARLKGLSSQEHPGESLAAASPWLLPLSSHPCSSGL